MIEKDYEQAFQQITALTKTLSADAEKNSAALKLSEVLLRVMREHHVLSDLKEAYQTIEFAKAKLILGLGGESD